MDAYDITLIAILVLLVLGGIGVWIWMEKQFKYRVRIKEVIKGRKIIKDHRAKYFRDKDGINWWVLAGERDKEKKKVIVPPEEAIEIDWKGRKSAECYRTETGEYIWLKEEGNIQQFPEEFYTRPPKKEWKEELDKIELIEDEVEKKEKLDKWKKKIRAEWREENNVIEPYEPLTTKQRMIYINNIRKAESRKPKDLMQNIVTIGSLATLGLVIVCLFIFWGDIAAPALEANKQAITMAQINKENLEILKEINTNTQRISNEQANINNRLDNIKDASIPN